MIPRNHTSTSPLPGPPPQLLLAEFCSVSLPDSNLGPHLLSLRATKVTAKLPHILRNLDRYQRLPKDNLADKGHHHGGIND